MRRQLGSFYDDGPVRRAQMTHAYVNGFLAAVIVGPLVVPSVWLPLLLPTRSLAGLPEANATLTGFMTSYNAMVQDLAERPEVFVADIIKLCGGDPSGTALRDWAQGFTDAADLRGAEWQSFMRKTTHDLFAPLAGVAEVGADPRKRDWLRNDELRLNFSRALAIMTVRIWELWRDQPERYITL